MIYKYTMYGTVRGTEKRISEYVSAPMGIKNVDFFNRLASFMKTFDDVKVTFT